MGAGSTVATAISFESGSENKASTKNTLTIEVKAMGYDSTLGGQAFDTMIQTHLAEKFESIHKDKLSDKSIINDSKAMARL
jgi:hypoxia up-regulated 1